MKHGCRVSTLLNPQRVETGALSLVNMRLMNDGVLLSRWSQINKSTEFLVGWITLLLTHAVKEFDALRLRLTHPTFH
jgi:hypothetical protein